MARKKHFELIADDTVTSRDGRKLFRIRALVAIATLGVSIGDLGGFVENEKNVSGDARVSGFFPLALRSDNYTFVLVPTSDGQARIIAGCRYFTLPEYWAHVETYKDAAKQRETLLILDFLESQAALVCRPAPAPAAIAQAEAA